MEEHTKYLYSKIFQAFEKRGEEFLCIFFLAVMVTCVFVQVIARYLFSTAITWSEELAGFCMAWAVYMGGSLGVRERYHIRIAMGVAALPRKIAVSLIVLGDLFWMAFNVAMIFLGTEYLLLLWRRTYIAPSLGIEQKWPQMIVALGYILMSLRLIQVYVRWLKGSRKGLPGIPQEQ